MLRSVLKLGKQSALYVVGDVATQVLGILLVPIYTNALRPEEFGLWGLAGTVQKVLATVLGLGSAGAISRFYFDDSEDSGRKETVGAVWVGWLLVGLPLFLLMNLVGPSVSSVVFTQVPYDPYIRLALWTAVLSAMVTLPEAVLRAREQAGWFSLLAVLGFVARAVLIIYYVVYRRQGVEGGLQGQFLGSLLAGGVYVGVMMAMVRWDWNVKTMRAALMFGLPLVPHRLATWALGFSDRWILQRYVSLSALGQYTLAYQFGLGMSMILNSLNRAWTPIFYQKVQELGGLRVVTRITTYYSIGVAWLGMATAVMAKPVIALIAKPDYHAAHDLVPLIAAGYAMQGMYFAATNAIAYAKRTRYLPFITGVAAATNIVLNLVLVPRLGAIAAALSTWLGYTVFAVIAFLAAQRVFPLRYELRRISLAVGIALICYAVGASLQVQHVLLELALRGVWVVAAYPAGLYLSGFVQPDEAQGLRIALSHLWARACRRFRRHRGV